MKARKVQFKLYSRFYPVFHKNYCEKFKQNPGIYICFKFILIITLLISSILLWKTFYDCSKWYQRLLFFTSHTNSCPLILCFCYLHTYLKNKFQNSFYNFILSVYITQKNLFQLLTQHKIFSFKLFLLAEREIKMIFWAAEVTTFTGINII